MNRPWLRNVGVALCVLLWPVAAFAQDKPSSKAQKPSVARARVYESVEVVCIGISDFARAQDQLQNPRRNVEGIAQELGNPKRFGFAVKTQLYDAAATRDAIRAQIEAYAALPPDQLPDALIIIISTHGVEIRDKDGHTQGFLIPSNNALDINKPEARGVDEWDRNAVAMKWVAEQVRAMKIRQVLVVVEACHSGHVGTMGVAPLSSGHKYLADGDSKALITATTPKQQARDGAFSGAMLSVLARADRVLTAREVHIQVREAVMSAEHKVSTTSGAIEPQMPLYHELLPEHGEFVLIPQSVPSEKLAAQIDESRQVVMRLMGSDVTELDLFDAYQALDYRFSADPEAGARDWRARVERYRTHASVKNPFAMATLYYCFAKGLGVEKDAAAAFHAAQEAFDSGNPVGKHVLGACYIQGVGIEKNEIAADRLFAQAAAEGAILSRFKLASDLLTKADTTKQPLSDEERERTLAWLREGVAANFPPAQTALGYAVGNGLGGVKADRQEAVKLLTQACDAGHLEACWRLANVHGTGIPGVVEKNLGKLRECLMKAADGGLATAQNFVGELFESGQHGFTQDDQKALPWIRLAASQKFPKAMMNLVRRYSAGKGVEIDLKMASDYLEQSVVLGDGKALFVKAQWLNEGKFYAKNEEQALALFEQAGEKGEGDAWFSASRYYEQKAKAIPHPSEKQANSWANTDEYQAAVRACDAKRRPFEIRVAIRLLKAERAKSELAKKPLAWYRENKPQLVAEAEKMIVNNQIPVP